MKVGIIGANGYSGVELIRLLEQHPKVDIAMVVANSTSGLLLQDVYPHLNSIIDMTLESLDIDKVVSMVDLVFFATPSGVSRDYLPKLVEKGLPCIDLSGDFRLKNPETYAEWYKKDPADQETLNQAVYGLAEFNQDKVAGAKVIANPGCFPTATLLGVLPAIKLGIIKPESLIIDGKTGVSGAGRKPSLSSHFSEVNENFKAYKVGQHQHTPEIEQAIKEITGEDVTVTFTPQLVPMTRGILITAYGELNDPKTTEAIIQSYKQFYDKNPFVRVRELGDYPATKEVYGSNYCDIGLYVDERTQRLTIISVIDNVVKGAAGQAIQNLNIMNGWDIDTGLNVLPVYP